MRCFHPIDAWQSSPGERLQFGQIQWDARKLQVACGQCIGCRIERSKDWAVRCVHEAACHEGNSFVTLTYDDAHLGSLSLVYRDFQNFMRRARRVFPGVRFFAAGEYGEAFERPHFHALLFGAFFEDREVHKDLPSGFRLYTSKQLGVMWPNGFSSIGDVTFESAAYVARYVLKKVTGRAAEQHYQFVDIGSGEVSEREPEFCRMSLKPGIGARWYERFGKEVYPNDYVVINGVKLAPPKYYDKLFGMDHPDEMEALSFERQMKAAGAAFFNEGSSERLATCEAVTKARMEFKKRGLK